MFTNRAELLDKGETTAEHSKNQRDEADRLDKDKANTNPQSGGLFGGLFRPKAPALKPVVDVEDGVVRCPNCAWELEDGENCPGCGWCYHFGDGTEYSGTDGQSETNYDSMDDDFGDIEEDDSVWGLYDGPQGPPTHYLDQIAAEIAAARNAANDAPFAHLHDLLYPDETSDYDYDEEEDDDYDEQDSFIDDDEHPRVEEDDSESDRDTVVGAAPAFLPLPSLGPPQNRVALHVPITEDEESEEDEDDDYISRVPHQRYYAPDIRPSSSLGIRPNSSLYSTSVSRSSLTPSEAETPEAETEAGPSEAETDGTNNFPGTFTWTYDPEASETENSSSPPQPMRSRTSGLTARNAITIEDSEDEHPVGPVRRGTQRRRARYSPY